MENVTWFGHASFMFKDNSTNLKIYYIDPFQMPTNKNLEKADIIFVTHAHPDHLSEGDISILLKEETVVVATPDSLEVLQIKQEKFPVEPNKEYDVRGFKFQTVPAYNVHPKRLSAHPRSNNWVGYVFEVNGVRFYHAGDTDFIPEMHVFDNLSIDVAMLPMGGKYTMDVDDVILAVNAIKPKKIIPMHYKRLLGDSYKAAEEKLKKGITNSEVLILEEFK